MKISLELKFNLSGIYTTNKDEVLYIIPFIEEEGNITLRGIEVEGNGSLAVRITGYTLSGNKIEESMQITVLPQETETMTSQSEKIETSDETRRLFTGVFPHNSLNMYSLRIFQVERAFCLR